MFFLQVSIASLPHVLLSGFFSEKLHVRVWMNFMDEHSRMCEYMNVIWFPRHPIQVIFKKRNKK